MENVQIFTGKNKPKKYTKYNTVLICFDMVVLFILIKQPKYLTTCISTQNCHHMTGCTVVRQHRDKTLTTEGQTVIQTTFWTWGTLHQMDRWRYPSYCRCKYYFY